METNPQTNNKPLDDGIHAEKVQLTERKSRTMDDLITAKRVFQTSSVATPFVIGLSIPTLMFTRLHWGEWYGAKTGWEEFCCVLAAGFVGIGLSFAGMSFADRMRVRELESDIEQIDIQRDLCDTHMDPPERQAEKLLRLNDSQLRRYYETNLTRSC